MADTSTVSDAQVSDAQLATMAKALGHPARIAILRALGMATADELTQAPNNLELRLAGSIVFADPVCDMASGAVLESDEHPHPWWTARRGWRSGCCRSCR